MNKTRIDHYLIFNTDSYVGNFELELMAYVLGVRQDHPRSEEWYVKLQKADLEEVGFFGESDESEGIIEYVLTEHGDSPQEIDFDYFREGVGCTAIRVKIATSAWGKITSQVCDLIVQRFLNFCDLWNATPDYDGSPKAGKQLIRFEGLYHRSDRVETTIEKI